MYHIDSEDASNILCEIQHLKYLIHLNIIYCYIPNQGGSTSYFWDQIWTLLNLRQINLKSYDDSNIDFTRLTVISLALENVSIKTPHRRSFNDMVYLFQYTSHLRNLSISIRCENGDEIFSNAFTSITTLNLAFNGVSHILNKFFQNMPNLCHLTIEIVDCYLTGHE